VPIDSDATVGPVAAPWIVSKTLIVIGRGGRGLVDQNWSYIVWHIFKIRFWPNTPQTGISLRFWCIFWKLISRRWLLLALRRHLRSIPNGFRVCLQSIWSGFECILRVLLLKTEIISKKLLRHTSLAVSSAKGKGRTNAVEISLLENCLKSVQSTRYILNLCPWSKFSIFLNQLFFWRRIFQFGQKINDRLAMEIRSLLETFPVRATWREVFLKKYGFGPRT